MTEADLRTLNARQREAVCTTSGPLLLLAGAGTGKTRVITYRIAHLLDQGLEPEHLLAVTFTNKAAAEMRERVAGLVPASQAERLTICTFHSFGMRLLRRHISALGYTRDFGIATESYQLGLVRNLMAEMGLAASRKETAGRNFAGNPDACLAAIHHAKSAMRSIDDLRADAVTTETAHQADLYEKYRERMRLMNLVDFDDLLLLVLELWDQRPDLLERHRRQYRHILVDEYQDTNAMQFHIVASLAQHHRNLCVVGDDDQSIYGWRGADITNILEFDRRFPDAKVIRLEQNYRSTETILTAANTVITRNRARREKRLWSEKGRGSPIVSVICKDADDEARLVFEMIRERRARNRRPLSDFAVLYRSNHQSRAFEQLFRRNRMPYLLIGSRSFYQRKEVLDAIAFLRAVSNPADDLSLLRILNVPPRGIGDRTIHTLHEIRRITGMRVHQVLQGDALQERAGSEPAARAREFCRLLDRHREHLRPATSRFAKPLEALLRETGYLDGLPRMYKPRADAEKRLDNVLEFLTAARQYQDKHGTRGSVRDFLDSVSLRDTSDRREKSDQREDAVTLLTVHAAKGLEFPIVFGVGLEQGLFPHENAVKAGTVEEERRLFYVLVTRAREELVLTRAQRRTLAGKPLPRRPSGFLNELPPELVEIHTGDAALRPASTEEADEAMATLRALFQ